MDKVKVMSKAKKNEEIIFFVLLILQDFFFQKTLQTENEKRQKKNSIIKFERKEKNHLGVIAIVRPPRFAKRAFALCNV